MAYKIRDAVFETNSSMNHSFSIHIGDYKTIVCYDEYERDDVYLEESDISEILDNLPIGMLENAVAWRKEQAKKEQKRQELQDKEDELWRKLHDNCRDCVGNGCDDCRGYDIKKTNDDLRRQIEQIQNERAKLY